MSRLASPKIWSHTSSIPLYFYVHSDETCTGPGTERSVNRRHICSLLVHAIEDIVEGTEWSIRIDIPVASLVWMESAYSCAEQYLLFSDPPWIWTEKNWIIMKIDFEIKAFTIVSIFALLRLLKVSAENESHLLALRGFFAVVHLFLALTFIRTNLMIESLVGAKETKIQSRLTLRKEFGNILFRAVVIALVHYKTLMMPPLIVSSVIGLFNVIENKDTSHVTFKTKLE